MWSELEAMAADLASADVVFVGERHGDPNTHALELALLEALERRRERGAPITVSLESFARDAQASLDAYLAGTSDEATFLSRSRPWPIYPAAHRPLVELARRRGWPVIAANVPRPLASGVAKGGLETLETLPPEQRAWIAADVQCPKDAAFDRFAKAMFGPAAASSDAAKQVEIERAYQAVCLQDETMGESVARAAKAAGTGSLVVHYNGAFHSDFSFGTVSSARRRLPNARIAVISIAVVDSLEGIEPSPEDLRRADYLVYTPKPGLRLPT